MKSLLKIAILIYSTYLLYACSSGNSSSSNNSSNENSLPIKIVTPKDFYSTQVNNTAYVYITNSESSIESGLSYQIVAAQGSASLVSIVASSAENCATINPYSSCQLAINIPANIVSGSFAVKATVNKSIVISPIVGIQQASANSVIGADGISISYSNTIESGSKYLIITGIVNSESVGNFNTLMLMDNNDNPIPGLTVLSSNLGAGLTSLGQGASFEILLGVSDGSALTQQFYLQTSMVDINGESSSVQSGNTSYLYTTNSMSGIVDALPENVFLTAANPKQQITLVNNGTMPAQLSELTANSPNLATNFSPLTLKPGESTTITVLLSDELTTPQNSSLTLSYISNNTTNTQLVNVYQNVAPFTSSTNSSSTSKMHRTSLNQQQLKVPGVSPGLQIILWPTNQFVSVYNALQSPRERQMVQMVVTNNSAQRINNINFQLPSGDDYYFSISTAESGLLRPCTKNANSTGITNTLDANGGFCDLVLKFNRIQRYGITTFSGTANLITNYDYIDGTHGVPVSQAVAYQVAAATANISSMLPRVGRLSVVANGSAESIVAFEVYNSGDASAAINYTLLTSSFHGMAYIYSNGCDMPELLPGRRCYISAALHSYLPSACINADGRVTGFCNSQQTGQITLGYTPNASISSSFTQIVVSPAASSVQLSAPVVVGFTAVPVANRYDIESGTAGATITYTISNNSESTITNLYWDNQNYYSTAAWRFTNQCGTTQQPISLLAGGNCTLQFELRSNASVGLTTLEPSSWQISYTRGGAREYVVISQSAIRVNIVPRAVIISYAPTVISQGGQFRIQLGLAGGLGNYSNQNITAQLQSPTNSIVISPNTCTLNSQNPQCSMWVTLAADATVGANIINFSNAGQVPFESSSIAVNVLEAPKVSFSKMALEESGACALADNNNTYCWGAAAVIGNGVAIATQVPTLVNMPESVVSFTEIAIASTNTVCAIANTGLIYCWGTNLYGQLGIGSNIELALSPMQVFMSQMTKFIKILAVSDAGFCALADTGQLYCWGNGSRGTIGNDSFNNVNVPTLVSMPYGVAFTDFTGSNGSVCALGSNLKTYCWGANNYGQLAIPYTTDVAIPTLTVGSTTAADSIDFRNVYLQKYGSDAYTSCGISFIWGSYCWGSGGQGQLGNGLDYSSFFPVNVKLGAGYYFKDISVGNQFVCSLGSDFKTRCWGLGTSGQLGNGALLSESVPVIVNSPNNVIFSDLASSSGFSCAIGDDGYTYCWGDGSYGRLGNGNTIVRSSPVKVQLPAGVSFGSLNVARNYSCGISSTGTAYCWGRGGVLGSNATQGLSNPVPLLVTMPIAN